jgi:hypothetical protein
MKTTGAAKLKELHQELESRARFETTLLSMICKTTRPLLLLRTMWHLPDISIRASRTLSSHFEQHIGTLSSTACSTFIEIISASKLMYHNSKIPKCLDASLIVDFDDWYLPLQHN